MHQANIKFAGIRKQNLSIKEELMYAFERVLNSGRFILGEEVAAFEKEFAAYCGTSHCIGVANGLDGSLRA